MKALKEALRTAVFVLMVAPICLTLLFLAAISSIVDFATGNLTHDGWPPDRMGEREE